MTSPTNSEQKTALRPEVMESLLKRGITITSSHQTPDGKWFHKGSVRPGATIFSRVPRPDKGA